MSTDERPSSPQRLKRRSPELVAADRAYPKSIKVTAHRWEHWKATAANQNQTLTRWLTELADSASGYQSPATPTTSPPYQSEEA